MNIFNARCCLLTLFFFLFEKKFCKRDAALNYVFSHESEERKGSAGTFALSNEPIYYAPSGGMASCATINRQLSEDEEDSDEADSEDRDDGGSFPGRSSPYEEGKKSDLVNDTPKDNLDGDLDEDTAEDGEAKRKMSKKEEEEEDKKIDNLVNAEMIKHEADNNSDEELDAEPDKEGHGSAQRSAQGRRPRMRCSNKLNYIEVTANEQGGNDLFSENDEESGPDFVEIPHKAKEDINGMPTKHNEREEAHDRIDRAEKETNTKDLKFVEGNVFMQEGEKHSEVLTDSIKEQERRRSSSSSSNGHIQNNFVDLKIIPDKLPLHFTNSSGTLYHKNMEKDVHKHLPWSILPPDSPSNRGSLADVNSSAYNVSPFSFISIHTHNALHLMPMNFQVQNSIMRISDEAFDKLQLKNSVHVYDKNELVDYKYENFEVKEGEEYNDGNELNEEKDVGERGSDGEADENTDSNSDQNNNSEGRGFFDGTLVTYTIVILIGVIILLLSFVIYYYDLINKVKRRMSAKRKNNKSMTIANDNSAGMYMDNAYKESPHV
ncbi:conserved Plasmodium protein, unknown function [Plasmodium knowlesi strain H]|uniref:Uncharacterized protein n=3 Tax=Plasmodium knowlesi TaxID=5850 RepID=A0A5K1TYR9_PLAKH|nr:conserved Plasmodium protein, unknown function [Plasmodium knowlesi strain H]OTN66961.1 Uncharacterized protein PKNOH_S07460300 [Plasmodium knowlesi]CAA9988728.1 conserved Plasmodium protein, unknown function [Plasmodium knowlesi strain H]SBO21678.1 conserved Plasmodium protein, unknown function [Plasmodium knowlesi strain H]SBO22041.1 conserved Plasmodium protein, unknown function [Plasmodium knowlesi strain H]VVS78202.1 conserved Plasmodium protein, unknown function [Plasmodium knowlesi s|eukprot:XP_002259703.1 hypothetical protein, conserved in Plasmodium species [Plasmodium knowlesi strain H]